jgi:putative ABC transport system substrate-binding protein
MRVSKGILKALAAAVLFGASTPLAKLLVGEIQPVTRGAAIVGAFRQGLREHGYMEGQNIIIEYRSASGNLEDLPRRASELVSLKVDVICTGSTAQARAAQQATVMTPIVAAAMGDAVEDGLASSLARPSGNITGLTFLGPELVTKRLELLREMLPTVSRVAALWQVDAFGERTTTDMFSGAQAAARRLGMQFQVAPVKNPGEIDRAFTTMVEGHTDAVIQMPGVMLFNERRHIVDLAAKHRLPTIYAASEFVHDGGLISYGADIADLFRRSATYVDKILKGAKPGDLPIEQPTKFELVVNLKTAKTLGLAVPQSLLLRADEVIE